ncbi:MAG TPA: YHS domain-containing protein [Acidiferrobacterales bacterium]|jgi:YHS domain-containing protein
MSGDRQARIDPVCKMAVPPAEAPPPVEYRGNVYYFCSEGCRKEFAADPERYLSGDRAGRHRHPGEPDGYV